MKIKEIKELETKDSVKKVENAKTALAKIKLNHQITPLGNPSQTKVARRDIAHMKTELSQRKLNK